MSSRLQNERKFGHWEQLPGGGCIQPCGVGWLGSAVVSPACDGWRMKGASSAMCRGSCAFHSLGLGRRAGRPRSQARFDLRE